jgi:hypothetical protein
MQRTRQGMAALAGGVGLALAVLTAPSAAADELLPDCDETGTVIDADGPTNCANPSNETDVESYPLDEAHFGFPSQSFFP